MEVNRFDDTEILIVGSTIAGTALALECRRAGLNTTLVMNTTSPATEIGSTMGAWLSDEEAAALPADLQQAMLDNADQSVEGVRLLHQTRAITNIEDLLLDSGVRVFYDAHPIGIVAAADTAASGGATANAEPRDETTAPAAAGALFGGKFGVSAVTAAVVVDATCDGRLIRRSGQAGWRPVAEESIYSACFLTEAESWHEAIEFTEGTTVARRGPLTEFRFPYSGEGPELHLRRLIIDNIAKWNAEHPDTAIGIERAGEEILVEPEERLDGEGIPGPEATGAAGLYGLGPWADFGLRTNGYLDCRTRYVGLATDLARQLSGYLADADGPDPAGGHTLLQPPAAANPGGSRGDVVLNTGTATVSLGDPQFDEPGVDRVTVELPPLPIMAEADLVVAGGGTSGAQAARQAAELGIDTLCLEKHSDLGGVSTIGGVPSYWFGRRTPYFKRLHARIKSVVRERQVPVAFGLMALAEDAGARVMLRTPTVGVVKEGGAVSHVLCITEEGLAAVRGRDFIDATGDGDLAAWAGVPYSYGSERDEITLWCSFGSFHRGKDEASRQYMSVVDPRSPHDTARGLIAGRRMGGIYQRGRFLQHYLALRESRHIRCRQKLNYHDIMMGRAFPDAVLYFKSNVDIKGMASSRAALCGYIEKSFLQNHEASIPFGATVPEGISNMLVVGKAFSATHDAVSMARMQPDLMSLGAVAAFAAGAARRSADAARPSGNDVKVIADADVKSLQDTLTDAGILLSGDLPHGPMDERVPPNDEGLIEIIERLSSQPVEPSEWARLFSRADETLRHIHRRGIISNSWVISQIDRLAASMGSSAGNERLLGTLDELLSGNELPGLGDLEERHNMPDHGFAPEAVYLINAIAWTGDTRLAPRLRRVVELVDIDPTAADYRFNYIHSIAYSAELLGNRETGEAAAGLMNREAIRSRLVKRDEADLRETVDFIGERYAYLGLCLARGAARCGLEEGYRRLATYTGEIRLYLARSARAELFELLGTDHGFDEKAWLRTISANYRTGRGRAKPFTRVLN